jgi:signal transduction histidine kinase
MVAGLCRDGRELPIELSLSVFHWRSERYFAAIMRDASARLAAEREQREQVAADLERRARALEAQARLAEKEAHAALGRLAAGLLHEINSPLGALRSASDTAGRVLRHCRDRHQRVAADDSPPPSAHTHRLLGSVDALCATLSAGTERISEVVERLARLAPVEGDTARPTVVAHLLDDALEALSEQLPPGASVVRNVCDRDLTILCQPSTLRQCLVGVLQNALAAVGPLGTLSVSVRREGSEACLTIVDDGPGMTEHELERACRVGFSARGGRVRLQLGLASCKHAVEGQGGSLVVVSRSGQGTRVEIRLPAIESTSERRARLSSEGRHGCSTHLVEPTETPGATK